MSEVTPGRELLICIVKDHHLVEEILMGFLEQGIRGATVMDARGMGQILSTDIPIFAGFRSLFPGGSSGTYVIFSVLDSAQIDEAVTLAEEVCGDFSRPGSGVLFTVPVGRVKGLAAEIQ
jgi:nitrogen regulatory protein P-II 1